MRNSQHTVTHPLHTTGTVITKWKHKNSRFICDKMTNRWLGLSRLLSLKEISEDNRSVFFLLHTEENSLMSTSCSSSLSTTQQSWSHPLLQLLFIHYLTLVPESGHRGSRLSRKAHLSNGCKCAILTSISFAKRLTEWKKQCSYRCSLSIFTLWFYFVNNESLTYSHMINGTTWGVPWMWAKPRCHSGNKDKSADSSLD